MLSHPFHRASFRPHLLMGAERKPMILLAVICSGLSVTSFNLVALGIAVALWAVFHPLLVWMGSVDPDLISIYFRNLKYPRHIPAFSTPFRKNIGYVVAKPPKIWNNR